MNEKTPRQEWFDFLEKYSNVPRPEDRLPYDNAEFLQKIKLYFDNRSVVCDGKIDLSYVFFRIKDVIDQFIDRDFRHEIDHIKGDLYSFRDRVNKELHDLKHLIDKSNEKHDPYIYPIDKAPKYDGAIKYDFDKLLKTLHDEIENIAIRLTRDINGVKDYVNELCAGIEETHKKDIDEINARIDAINNDINAAVRGVADELRKEIEAEVENARIELQAAIDNVHNELQSLRDSIGKPNGIASLDKDGKISSDQLPEWTDDVIEVFADYTVDGGGVLVNISLYEDFKKTDEILEGEEGKLYVDITNNNITYIFRWTGREWVCVNNFVLHSDIANIQSEIANVQSDITSLQSDVESLYINCATKSDLNGAIESLEKEISNIIESTGSEDERISALEYSVEALESDVKTNADAIEELKESKQDKLTAGDGIDITDNVISSTVDTTLYEVVANLPTTDIDINKIYVVPVCAQEHNKCTEYIYVDGEWEILGNEVDLSDYYTIEQTDALLEIIDKNVAENTENIATNTSNIEKNTTNIESNTTKISQIEDTLAELGVEIGDDESKLSTIEKQVEANTAAIETKQDKLTAGTGIAINEINGETVIACTLDTSLYIFCTVLPTTDIDPNKIYVTPSNEPGEDNVYIEWLYVDGVWEKIGELHSDMDMSDYYTKSEVDAKINTLETSIEGVSTTLETTKSELESSIESTKNDLQSQIDTNTSNIETNTSAISALDENKQNKLVEGTNISLTDNVDGTTTISCVIDTACYKIVASLPSQPDDADVDKIFMVPSNDQESQNEFVEYIWVDTVWEQIGTNSYTKAQIDAIKDALQESIDTLTSTVESNNTSVTDSIEKLESSVESLESSLESTKSDLQSAIDANTASIETNTANIESNKESIETNTNEITKLSESKQDKLTAGTGIAINEINGETVIECTIEGDITSLQEQVDDIDSDLKTAEDAIAINSSAIETLQDDVASNTSAIEELQSDVETKQDKLTTGTGIAINEINGETIIAWTEESRLSDAESNIVTNTEDIESLQDSKQDKLTAGYGISITEIEGEHVIMCTIDSTLYKVVTVLPTQPDEEDENKIFVVPSPTQGDDNLYVEYIWVIDAWEKVGELHTEVDLSDYYTKSEIDSTVSELKDAIETNTSTIETNKEAIESNASSISALETKHQSDIDSLNALVSDLTGVEHTDFENVQSLISGLQESVNTNTSNIETLQSQLDSANDSIDELKERLSNDETTIASNTASIESNTSAIENLESTKQDTLSAGTGISIENNVIACTLDTKFCIFVDKLPETGEENKLYLVKKTGTVKSDNIFDEWIWGDETGWEYIGGINPEVDLVDYYTKTQVDDMINELKNSLLNDLKPYLENISSSIETLQGDVTNIKETVEDTSDDIKIITQILASMTGTSI